MWFAYYVKCNYLWDSPTVDVVYFYVYSTLVYPFPVGEPCFLFLFYGYYVNIIVCLLMHIYKGFSRKITRSIIEVVRYMQFNFIEQI